MNGRLKIGLLVDAELVPKYVYDLVVWASQQHGLRISHLIIQEGCGHHRGPRQILKWLNPRQLIHPSRAFRAVLWKIIRGYESYKLNWRDNLADTLRLHDIGHLIEGRIRVVPVVSKSGFVHRFSEEDIERIQQERFDLLFRGGSGILRGNILNASRLGILSFHHGDNRHYRGGPPGFWEVYRRDPRTGFSLQILTEELDGGKILARGHFPTQNYYLANRATLQERANHYLKNLLLKVASTRELPPCENPVPYCGPLYKDPTTAQLLRYAWMQAFSSLRRFWFRRVGIRDRWHVGYSPIGWRDAAMWRGSKIPNPPGRFLADPFLFDSGAKIYCYVEEYSYRTGKGRISVFEIQDSASRYVGVAIEEAFHMSFPFMFRFNGAAYMCPETGEAGEIRVYKCASSPLGWELAAKLMNAVRAADTMLFEANGRWWMLTNLDTSQIYDRSAELHLFSSDSPLSSDWTAHPMNPLIVDSGRARNGGLILDGGKIFRVAQIHGAEVEYGKGAVVFEIVQINETEYVETLVCTLTPSFGPGVMGIHHMDSNGKYTVWDFRTRERVS